MLMDSMYDWLLLISSRQLIVYKTGSLVGARETDLVWHHHKGIFKKNAKNLSLSFVIFRLERLVEEAWLTISVI